MTRVDTHLRCCNQGKGMAHWQNAKRHLRVHICCQILMREELEGVGYDVVMCESDKFLPRHASAARGSRLTMVLFPSNERGARYQLTGNPDVPLELHRSAVRRVPSSLPQTIGLRGLRSRPRAIESLTVLRSDGIWTPFVAFSGTSST